MQKLISMTDFVLERSKQSILGLTFEESLRISIKITKEIFNYANFLKQLLKLEMFVPCDEDGNVLEMPVNYSRNVDSEIPNKELQEKFDLEFLEYEKAKEKVLFEGFNIKYQSDNKIYLENENKVTVFFWKKSPNTKMIEDLIPTNLNCLVKF